MIYLGFGSALGARGLSEHIPRGVFASETARCNSVSHFVTRWHLKSENDEAFCRDLKRRISVEHCSVDLPVSVVT